MSIRAGIDLGTTYSAISWYQSEDNRAETIDLETADGERQIRSVVYYPPNGEPVVIGDHAWNAARQHPERVLVGIKQSMGTDYTKEIDGRNLTPEEISSEILKVLVADAQRRLGEDVKEVVITVPAYFADAERTATQKAGEAAGLTVLALLPEPHAAALAYAVEMKQPISEDRHILVYDLGGGTFDVTLIRAVKVPGVGNTLDLEIKTLCKDGEANLGGLQWDSALADLVAERVQQEYGVNLREDPRNEAALLDSCEKAKRSYGHRASASIIAGNSGHQVAVTRDEFEAKTRDLLERTKLRLEQVFADAAKLNPPVPMDQIDVMLTGGSTRMPAVEAMVKSLTGRAPFTHKNPGLLVSVGAAYWAHLLSGAVVMTPVQNPDGTTTVKPMTGKASQLVDVSLESVGVAVLRPDGNGGYHEVHRIILPKGSEYPGQPVARSYSLAEDGMTEIDIMLYVGESEDISQCRTLKTFTISGLPSGRPKGGSVELTLGYDQNGIIAGKAVDKQTGKSVDIRVERA